MVVAFLIRAKTCLMRREKDNMNKDKQPVLNPGDKIIYGESDPHVWYDNMKEALENAGFTLSKEVA